MPFGFPSGEELVSCILKELEGEEPAGTALGRIHQAMAERESARDVLTQAIDSLEPEMLIDSFREALFYSGRQSIDTFLEHNPQFLKVGKMAIASVLVPLEHEQTLFSTTPNWYKLLFNHLNTRFEEFAENKLSILTYNYDRSLEQFLLTALRNSYQGKKAEYDRCWEQLSRIPIVHLHGSLGEFPHSGPDELSHLERVYEPHLTCRDLNVCAETIRVISEDVAHQPQFQQAHSLLRSADVICFLGFGWDRTNLDRLQMNTHENWKVGRKRYGTSYNKGEAEQDWIRTYFGSVGKIELGNRGQRIDDFLGDFPVLF
ncbi:SIR2 family protein [Candidatus Bipolaricaulota bacterium]|nr:SIR2 family protein [Candidatus Bipolaricaulota bacterium]